ncbi:sugar ABC transporter ATP-binding protein [Conexibacter woesei]|uniref:ABC transporter related protein n=1 Tax=Conexibacter woesei (strain DSM 14684 / CCUG 47730 / CIP 108061 / JCM 11494 / NBRC 100937 / ID131577) TaxID=469383 RepID=D3F4E2_CONWI|nr:sugar ABC transporter ATP-binding protein [Conexibacter woesei]ADB50514.1 ABC transporter related protein [Conexibacter woesei DSM 14684]
MVRAVDTTDVAPLIELAGVGKRFGEVRALSGVDLAVGHGEVHAFVGENGAGKSTLVKVLMGVHRPDDGTLRVDGRERHYHSPHDALQDGVAGIAQEISLVPQRSVMENVFLGREPRRAGVIDTRALRRRLVELQARTGFQIPPDARAGSLSIADQQRVEILRALARDARVIVMDEPTAALSKTESEKLFEVVRRLRAGGTTVIYISHFLQEVLALADRVTILREGRVVRSGESARETTDSLVTAMLGRALGQVFPPKRPPAPGAPVRLAVRDLSRGSACRDIGFDVRAGEIVGFAGLVGSGRTEMARALIGADRADTATVAVDGRPVRIRAPKDSIRCGIAYLPESRKDDGLMMSRPAAENITLPHLRDISRVGVVTGANEASRCLDLLHRVKATVKGPRDPVRALSGGNQQKVLFARWLFSKPKVLIADEPTRGVDLGAKAAIYELIRELADEGIAVVVISSEHEELIGLSDRVLVMRGGRVVRELADDQITEDNIVSAALTV